MEDIVQIRIVFVVGLLMMAGVLALLVFAVVWLGEWLRARAGHARPAVRGTGQSLPARGTR